MTTTYSSIYASRCINNVPTFWVPRKLNKIEPCLFGDETVPAEESWNVEDALHRCIALALQLELPVGEWVGAFTNNEKNRLSEEVDILLKTNIKDETMHYRGFKFASEALGLRQDVINESKLIGEAWDRLPAHTIAKAGYAEMGVFMLTLAILRLTGGTELADLSQRVAEDEFRHVATNRGVMTDLGLSPASPSPDIQKLIDETLEWVVGDLHIPADELCEDYDFDLSFVLESSRELVEDGIAKRLNDLLDYQVHCLPFEQPNFMQYARSTEVSF